MKIAVVDPITRTPLSYFKIPRIKTNDGIMIFKLAEFLAGRGHEVDLFISDAYQPQEPDRVAPGVRCIYLPTRLKRIFLPSLLPFLPGLFTALKKGDYDSVVSAEAFQFTTFLAALAKCFSRKKFRLLVWQELARHQRFCKELPSRFFYAVILKGMIEGQIDLYVPRGALARKFLLDLGLPPAKVTAPIPHGIDRAVFFPDKDVVRGNYIFSPSRLVQAKGIDILLQAFAMVHQERGDLRLVIQGEGLLLAEYQGLARGLGVGSHVVFDTARIPHAQMRERYQHALLSVFSSRNDLMFFSVMESVACGTPVILSTGADIHFDFMDNKGGRVFPSGDPASLAQVILSLLKDKDLLRRTVEESIVKSREYFNDTVYERLNQLLVGLNVGKDVNV